jgi:predicted O-linked N-acetylglucosamine transferase (SPINDLY family)
MSEVDARGPAGLVEAGRALHRAGKLEEAGRLYAQALAQDADCAEAHQLLAVIAGQHGRFDEAIAGFRRTIALEGLTPDRLFNLAEAYRLAGKFDDAFTAYNQAVTIDAGFLDAYRLAAQAAREAAALAVAQAKTEAADRLNKLAAHYLLGLGHACLRLGDSGAAERAYLESVALDPAKAEAVNNLGSISLSDRHRPAEAESLFRQALSLEPRSPAYRNGLGLALRSQIRLQEAAELFRQAVEIDPSYEEASLNLNDRMLLWQHYRSDLSPSALFAAHRDWGSRALARGDDIARALPALDTRRDPERPLRIGYFGIDTTSPLTHCFIEPLLANHDRAAFTAFLYASAWVADADVQRLKKTGAIWQPTYDRRAKELAEMIRKAGIDILVDVAGHLPHNVIDTLAVKPAPVLVSWLGYPDTTGLTTVDYRLTDEIADPPGAEQLYTERLYRLQSGSLVYRPAGKPPAIAPMPAREAGAVTFGYLDDVRKIAPETVQAWSSILEALPRARLLLACPEFADTAIASRLQTAFGKRGIGAARLQLLPSSAAAEERLGLYAQIDIGLDAHPFNMSLDALCESLWMGVPVIGLSGDRPCARTSASVLARLGLERLIADTPAEYAAAASELAQDLDRLRSLRSGMRERMRVSPLMDERDFARRFEAALRDMWRRWCQSGYRAPS